MSTFPPPPKGGMGSRIYSKPKQFSETIDKTDTVASGKLDDTEVMFILRKYLTREQYDDPCIIKFILEYMTNRSTSQAARESGFTSGQGIRLRSNPQIFAALEALTTRSLMKYGYDATEVIERVKEIAALDPIEFENPDGSFKTHMSQIAPEARRAIRKFKAKNIYGEDPNGMRTVIGQLIEVEIWDKMKGLELLGREKNIFKETKKIEHDITSNMASVLLESKKRADQVAGTIDVTPQITGHTGETHATDERSDSNSDELEEGAEGREGL